MMSSQAIDLTLAGRDAAELFAVLQGRAFPETWDVDVFATMLDSHHTHGILAAIESAPVGFAVLQCAAGEAEVITIGVDPAARRRGVGRALVVGMARTAAENAAKVLFLEVSENNLAARNLYEKCGFKEIGRRPRYYANGASALICRLDLPGAIFH